MSGDIDRALADIIAIRGQIAAGTAFRGYGPAALALTGLFALGTWAAQHSGIAGDPARPVPFVVTWAATAALSVAAVGAEMRARAHRHHSGLADEMVLGAVERFLPAGACGALLAVVLLSCAPDVSWLLPGVWQMLVGIGTFASVRTLPGNVSLVGSWYVVAGLCVAMAACETRTLDPWMMGLPFAVGQFLMAWVLHRADGGDDDQA